ncbi:aminoacyl-tRNA hydrolase [Desulfopila sp. IMCC35006]|uniref:aminoacyl-tRNA hydrolase n=1 Tax=Desulfopila sp. IMCC35006 TaxID=2569542 RepID=UPI0010AB540C|nr:aminoacyl-tRNA hydrolase [Desulfopila sp. IMCC35006]TKB27971.1 aminoacyl-tRNA hydrolase [Desulfopila sp. IMCC35006]
MEKQDFIIVGLGNPGAQYQGTRHNVGFFVVDELARRWNASDFLEKWQAQCVSLPMGGEKVHLIKPLTFMNRSGRAVGQFYRFYKTTPDQLLVVHDDLDMAPGRIKLVKGGGAGGHNGIKSLVESLGTPEFYRLKIGIGRPGNGDVHPDFPVDKYVLGNFTDGELEVLQSRYDSFAAGIHLFLQGQVAKAMNLLNSLK